MPGKPGRERVDVTVFHKLLEGGERYVIHIMIENLLLYERLSEDS